MVNQSDFERIERLNHYLDNYLQSPAPGEASEFAPIYQHLGRIDSTPGPEAAFAERLRRQLMSSAQPATPAPVRRIPRHWVRRVDFMSAAALIVAVLAITVVQILDEPGESQHREAFVPSDATPTVVARPRYQGTIPPTSEGVAFATPTSGAVAIASPTADPTLAPDATTPAGVTPPIQLGSDFPEYSSLQQLVNTADLIVTARFTGNVVDTHEQNPEVRAFEVQVESVLRGEHAGDTLSVWQLDELEPGATYLLFLMADRWTGGPSYQIVRDMASNGFTRLNGNEIVPKEFETTEFSVADEYGNRPVTDLADDIAAIPDIDPSIRDLLTEHGWNPIGKAYLQVVQLPAREAFNSKRSLRYSTETWEMALEASRRTGLDFSLFAGQALQLLPYYLERRPADGQRSIEAMLLIDANQQIVGAWVTVSLEEQAFGLDQREQALAIPAAMPTPEPTPTFPVPDGTSVNPAQLYSLADAQYMIFCWPYCDQTLQSDELRDEIVQALNADFPLEDISAYPTPTPDYSLEQSSGTIVQLVFWVDQPFQGIATAFTYDRQTGKVLLPFDGGWIDAPPELAEALAGIDPPPPLTKP